MSAYAVEMGSVVGYRVSDLLIGAAGQPETPAVPTAIWRAVAEQAEPHVASSIGDAAWSAGLPAVAEYVATRGAEADDPDSPFRCTGGVTG